MSQINILIDIGASSLPLLKKHGFATNQIDIIVISHFHGDHFGGLPAFFLDAKLVARRKKKLHIVTPRGGRYKIKRLMEIMYPGSSKVLDELPVIFSEFSKHPAKILNVKVSAFPVKHSKPSKPHAVRIEIGKKIIAYSGDTEWTESLIFVSKNADLFLCECNFFRQKVQGHMRYHDLVRHLDSLKCKRILLTHLGEEMLGVYKKLEIETTREGAHYLL